MFVGTTGVQRTVERTAELMKEHGTDDVFPHGGIPLAVIQKYLNFQFAVSMDLFGSEQSTNAGNYFTSGLKGRWGETRRKDDHLLHGMEREMNIVRDGKIVQQTVPMLGALNIMGLATPQSAILSAVIFNALVIIALIPIALRGVGFRPAPASELLQRNLLIYGLGGLIAPFIGIKAIDVVVTALHLA